MLEEEDVEKINKWVKRLESKRRTAAQRKIGEKHRGGRKDWRIKTKENIGVWKENSWKTSQGKRKKEIKVKLSKLEITKFNWNHLGYVSGFNMKGNWQIKTISSYKVFIFKKACNIEWESFHRWFRIYNREL